MKKIFLFIPAIGLILAIINDSLGIFSFTKKFQNHKYSMRIEVLNDGRKEYIHVNSATSRKDPYISSIGSWHHIRLTNDCQNLYSVLGIWFQEKQSIDAFKEYFIQGNTIYLSTPLSLPTLIGEGESIDFFIFIPFRVDKNLGKQLFKALYKEDNKLDSYVELYLFGQEPMTPPAIVPMYIDDKFVGTIPINIEILNWEEHYAHRNLFKDMNFSTGVMRFEHDMHDGFTYAEKDNLLATIVPPSSELSIPPVASNHVQDTTRITFETNKDINFSLEFSVDSTGLWLTRK